MSWNGFKKAINRASNNIILVKNIDKTNDEEFNKEYENYKKFKKNFEKINKSSKKYIYSLDEIIKSQINIIEISNKIYASGDNNFSIMYNNILKDISEGYINELKEPYDKSVIEPINKIEEYCKEIDMNIKKRDHKRQDYEVNTAKIRRYNNKKKIVSSEEMIKFEKLEYELKKSKEIYQILNNEIKEELFDIIELSDEYFKPSFDSIKLINLRFCSDGYFKLSNSVEDYWMNHKKCEENNNNNSISSNRLGMVDEYINEMEKLGI